MRIRVLQTPPMSCIDGIQLDHFKQGLQYEVGNVIGALLLAEGWAEPVISEEPAVLIPISEFHPDRPAAKPKNLLREVHPPKHENLIVTASERQPRARRRS